MPTQSTSEVYPELKELFGAVADDARVLAFLARHRAKRPSLTPGTGFSPVDLKKMGLRLLFWVGWGNDRMPKTYAVNVGTLVEAHFFQEGIDKHRRFAGRLPHGLHVDMTRGELTTAFGAPTEQCDCGQAPPCFLAWHIQDFDDGVEAHVTHHSKHAGRTRPRPDRVDISIHVPRSVV